MRGIRLYNSPADRIKGTVTEHLFAELMRGAGASVNERAKRASCAAHGGDNRQAVSWRTIDGVVKWHCFTGDHGGTVIDFVMEAYGMDIVEALTSLSETLGLNR